MKKNILWFIFSAVLVVTMVIGFLLMGREIQVTVDGKTTSVFTRAFTVGQLLHQMGYTITPTDNIDPSAGTWLSNVESVTYERSRNFILWVGPSGNLFHFQSPARTPRQLLQLAGISPAEDDEIKINGKTVSMDSELPASRQIALQYLPAIPVSVSQEGHTNIIRSTAGSLGQALWLGDVHVTGSDTLSAPFTMPLQNAQEVLLTKPVPITIQVDGTTRKSMSSAATIAEALQFSGISLENMDYTIPSEDSSLPADGNIRVVRVREEVLVQQQSIPYKVKYQPDDTLELDQQKEVTAGQYGIAVSRIIVHFEDGEETSRKTEDTVTLVEPVDQKISYGTKIVYHTIDTDDGPITYYRAITVFATSYSPCRSDPADGSNRCISGTATPGVKVQKGVIATTVAWYSLLQGQQLYVPGYGIGTVEDTGGGISGRYWIDLGYSDTDYVPWAHWVTIYFLAPAPANVPRTLP